MAQSGPEMGFYVIDDAMRAAGSALHALLPPNGVSIEHRGLYLVDTTDTTTVIVMTDGTRELIHTSLEVLQAFKELRRVMYKPGSGTWFSVTMILSADWQAETWFNNDQDPTKYEQEFSTDHYPGGIAFLTDLQTYPIDEDKRPEWLKRYVADGIAELNKYGRSSYPKWLKKMTRFGKKPSWLTAVPEEVVNVPAEAASQPMAKRRFMDAGLGIDLSDWSQVFSASLGRVLANQMACDKLVIRRRNWFVDFTKGTLAFGDDEYPVQFLGSEAYERNTWLWGWENINHFPDNVVSLAQWMRQTGTEWNLEPLTTVSFDLTDVLNGNNLSIVACSICEQSTCFYAGWNGNGGRFFMIFSGLPDEVFAPVGALDFVNVTMQAMNEFSVDHTIFVKSFLYQNGTPYDEEGDTIVAHFDQDVRIMFEQTGDFRHISSIQAAMHEH